MLIYFEDINDRQVWAPWDRIVINWHAVTGNDGLIIYRVKVVGLNDEYLVYDDWKDSILNDIRLQEEKNQCV